MKFLTRYENRLKLTLVATFIICLLILFASQFIEFNAWLGKLGDLIVAIGCSYIVAGIFYFVGLKVDRDRQRHYDDYVRESAAMIVERYSTLLINVLKTTGGSLHSDDDIKNALVKLDLESEGYGVMATAEAMMASSWRDCITDTADDIKRVTTDLVPFIFLADQELSKCILEIYNAYGYYSSMDYLKQKKINNAVVRINEEVFINFKRKVDRLSKAIWNN